MKAAERLAVALAHAQMGRDIFPFELGPADGGGRRSKIPKVKWTQEATTDEETIRAWWRRWPLAMPGWRLPPGVVVVDVDDPAQFEAAGLDIDLGTASQITPRAGYHLAYEHDTARTVRQTVKEIEGADTRVGGKGWVGLYSADSFDRPMARAPEWLYGEPERESSDEPIGEEMGTRDEILRWLGVLRRQRHTQAEMLALLMVARDDGRIVSLDEARPWRDTDLRALAKEAAKWEAGPDLSGMEASLDGLERWKARVLAAKGTRRILTDEQVEEGEFFTPLVDVDPTDPKALELGFIDPEEHTILFGDGGTGKGMMAAWWVAQLSQEGLVFVLDYEAHARYEWRPRVERFGGYLSRVFIAQPATDAIWAITGKVRAEVMARAADMGHEGKLWLVVDSIAYACIGAPVEDSSTAIRYSTAIAEIALPTLSLAHTTKADDDPKHPFGSVFWSNGARVTIGMTGGRNDPWRRLENKKTNQRGYFPTIQFDWAWAQDSNGGIPEGLSWKVADGSPEWSTFEEAILAALDAEPAGLTVPQLVMSELVRRASGSKNDKSLRSMVQRTLSHEPSGKDPGGLLQQGEVVPLGRASGGRAQVWARSKMTLPGSDV